MQCFLRQLNISILCIQTSQFPSIWTFKLRITRKIPIKIFTLFAPTRKVSMSYEVKKRWFRPSHSVLITVLYIFFWNNFQTAYLHHAFHFSFKICNCRWDLVWHTNEKHNSITTKSILILFYYLQNLCGFPLR